MRTIESLAITAIKNAEFQAHLLGTDPCDLIDGIIKKICNNDEVLMQRVADRVVEMFFEMS